MSAISGKRAVFKLDSTGGSLTALTTQLNEITLPRELEELETTVFGSSFRTYIAGFQSATIDLSGVWSTLADNLLAKNLGSTATKSFEYSPDSTSTGKRVITGECVVTSYEMGSAVGDVTTFSGSLRVTGAVSLSVH